MDYEFLIDNVLHKITVEKKNDFYSVSDGDQEYETDIRYISDGVLSILIGQKSYRVCIARDKDRRYVSIAGQNYIVKEPAADQGSFAAGESGDQEGMLLVKAPMPGKVIKINVRENEEIRKNQTLAIVEAMKMENEIKSSIEGIVKKIYVATGDLVDSEKPLIELDYKS
ncbi:MAG: acetyl-CoA carboxylase biotin carboxyl carrier protein subunit [Candidatus Aminicenantes bacterium]|nr:acetyl-CoA carboxylase biotin carboxyl carrier protein subunit [Candidatus Aminicenantes bacterium]